MQGFVYILKSQKNGRYYIGSTVDTERRFREHQSGCVRATRNSRPFERVFLEAFETIQDARRIEYRLKRLKSRKIIERIIKDGKIVMGQ